MSLPVPLSVSPLNALTNQDLSLRPFQRVTAQVLSVTGTTAILAIEGYPVVVQLTSADQATTLLSQKTAQFVITQLSDQLMTLKFVKNPQSQAPQTPIAGTGFSAPELAVRLLGQNNIPITLNNLMMARSVLKQHLPVTPGLLNDLLGALSDYGAWGGSEADLAAALKAAGLPVTAESLALASRQTAQTSESLANLIGLLKNASGQALPAQLIQELKAKLQILNEMVLQADGEPSKMAEQLKAAVQMLGRSLESVLLEQSQNSTTLSPENSLLSLARLQQMLEQSGKNELAKTVNNFLEDLRQKQFLNSKPISAPDREEWSEIGLMVQNAQQKTDDKFSSARLRIARESKPDVGKIKPDYTRIILQVDINPGETVEVDLALTGKQIRTKVTGPDPVWCEQAQNELPSLDEALQTLGFNLKDAKIDIGNPQQLSNITIISGNPPLMTVDIEA